MKTEEAKELFHELKARFEAGTMSEEEFQAEIRNLLYQDSDGNYWTLGARTEEWYRYDDDRWLRASPPPTLEPVKEEIGPPVVEQEPSRSTIKWDYGNRIILGLASFLLLLCLIVVALASYQLGRLSVMTRPTEDTVTPVMAMTEIPSTEVPSPLVVRTAPASPGVPGGLATPLPTSAKQETSPAPTPTPRPTSTPQPTASMAPAPAVRYSTPILLSPEVDAIRGPGYDPILEWLPVGELAEDEYYHVEVCWNGCDNEGDFHGHYLQDNSYVFPSHIYRGQALDSRYYWHVIVRLQTGDAPAGPTDPPISPPSDTWVFLLTTE